MADDLEEFARLVSRMSLASVEGYLERPTGGRHPSAEQREILVARQIELLAEIPDPTTTPEIEDDVLDPAADDTFSVIQVEGEGYTTECPHCKALGTINEADSAIRWNTLEFGSDPLAPIANTGGSGDWYFDKFICTSCLLEVSPPSGFEIQDWT